MYVALNTPVHGGRRSPRQRNEDVASRWAIVALARCSVQSRGGLGCDGPFELVEDVAGSSSRGRGRVTGEEREHLGVRVRGVGNHEALIAGSGSGLASSGRGAAPAGLLCT